MTRLRGTGIIPALFLALWAGIVLFWGQGAAQAQVRLVIIGSSSSGGSYSPAAGAIAKLANEQRSNPDLRFVVEYSPSPIHSIEAVLAHEMDFAVVPSDQQYQAYKGLGEWKELGPQKELRSVFTINTETFFLVASQGSNILAYPDLKGKVVGVGDPDSDQARNFARIMGAYGLSLEDLARAEEYKTPESAKMLQDGRMDAFVYLSGNPSELIREAVAGRVQLRLVPVDEKELEALTAQYGYYTKAAIPLADYPKALNTEDAPTIAVKASLVTSAQASDEEVYALTRAVFEKLVRFRSLDQAFAGLRAEDMLKGSSTPIHPGALKYFKEAGLIKPKPAPKPKLKKRKK